MKVLISLLERIFLNILLRVDQGSDSLLAKGDLIINTKRFKPIIKKNSSIKLTNLLAIVFISLAIFLRKEYGAL